MIPCDCINKNFMIETLRSKFLAIGGMYISYKFEVLYEKEKAGEGFMLTCLHFDLYEKGKGYYCSWSQL